MADLVGMNVGGVLMTHDRPTALVTGGATGIGLATAQALGKEGTNVYIGGRDTARGEAAAELLRREGIECNFLALDVRVRRSVLAAFGTISKSAGRLDVLVNNAGIDCPGGIEDLSEDEWDDCLDTNLKGAYLCSRAAIPLMRAQGGGAIVNNASNAGLVARAGEPAYSASKAGLLMLTRSMALAYAKDRIRVNAVCPGPVAGTEIMRRNLGEAEDRDVAVAGYLSRAPLAKALGRMIDPGEVASLIVYLCSDAAAMITGAVIAIDGGKSAGPAAPS
jgi:NAD(P)-dependent dehydrogenase (short-subunit alcohol dehydrogenase family)